MENKMRFIDFLNESSHKPKQLRRLSLTESDKIVFHSYKELKKYCDDPENPLDVVVLGKEITSLRDLFYKSSRTNKQFKGIEDWDVSNIEDMSDMFRSAENFNQPLDKWDVSNVTEMPGMFRDAKSFNQPIGNWDTSNVTIMSYMFQGAESFNQPIDKWDIWNVEETISMFQNAKNFNQHLNNWSGLNIGAEYTDDMFKGSKLEINDNLPYWYRE
jgi:surface protein